MPRKPPFPRSADGKAPAHRSVSQLETLAKCGQQYAFRYLDGLKEPGSLARAKGSAVHEAAQGNFEQKITSDVDLPMSDFRDLAAAAFEGEIRSELLYTREEQSIGVKAIESRQKDATVKLAEYYHHNVSPDYQPAAVEQPFSIALPSAGTTLVGVIDLQDMHARLIDSKTSKRAKAQAEADSSLQLTAYAAAATREGKPPPEIILDTVVQTAGGASGNGKTYRNKLVTHRGPDDYAALAARIVAAEKIIKAGAFGPAPTGAWWCSAAWCGFHRICPFVNHSRTADE